MTKKLKLTGFILLIIVFPIMLLAGIFLFGKESADIRDTRIEDEVFSYVLDNGDTLPKNESGYFEHIPYMKYNDIGVTIEYGYFYSETMTNYDENCLKHPYRNGYRFKGYSIDGNDWLYVAKICDNWYYYEEHDG